MITVSHPITDLDRMIVGNIIDPLAPKIHFKKNTFDCETIEDAVGNVFVKQKTGEWIEYSDNYGHSSYFCSRCGTQEGKPSGFCPNCGAKMEEE